MVYRMPSVAKSTKWFIRVDGNKDDLTERCKEMKGWIDTHRIYGMYHTGETKENPHCHIVIELTSELQKQSMDVRVKKLFKIDKKSNYSSKVWDGSESAISYMYHEPDAVGIVNKGFSEDELDKCKELNASVQRVVALAKNKSPGKSVDKVIEHFRVEGYTPSRRDIARQYLNMIRDGEMFEPGNWHLEKLIEEAYLKTRPASEWDDYVEDRVQKLLSRM